MERTPTLSFVMKRREDHGSSGAPLLIGEVAARADVTPDTLRYYERLGLLEPPARSRGGYRLYSSSALERLGFVKKAQALGLTLAEIRDVIRVAHAGEPPCRHVEALLRRRIDDIDRKVEELRDLRRTLVDTVTKRRSVIDGDACVCQLIEGESPRADEPRRA